MRSRSYARARAELREAARWTKLLQEQDEVFDSMSKRHADKERPVGKRPERT